VCAIAQSKARAKGPIFFDPGERKPFQGKEIKKEKTREGHEGHFGSCTVLQQLHPRGALLKVLNTPQLTTNCCKMDALFGSCTVLQQLEEAKGGNV